jgi:hypothetical protein
MFIPVPKAVKGNGKHDALAVPVTLLAAHTIQSQESRRILRAMLDSGGSHTMISSRMLPKGATPSLETGRTFKTIAGKFFSGRLVSLSDIVMPEFDKTRKIDGIKAFVFDEPCVYDIILGRDFLHKTGIDVLFSRELLLGWIRQFR